jgi:CTP:molybdopterin cytidylyltransferase MocA
MLGADGRTRLKPLLPFGGSTLVETAVRAASDAGARVLLMLGNRREEVAALFDAEAWRAAREEGRLLILDNPRWEEGMLVSIQTALPEVRGEAFFIAHADMPFISSESYRTLAEARAARASEAADKAALSSEAAIVASHGGRGGHPVLLPSAWIPGILELGPEESLRTFLGLRRRVTVERGPGALRDIDTPEEYLAALEACKRPESM